MNMNRSVDSLKAFMGSGDRSSAHVSAPGVTVVGSGKGGVGTSVVSILLALEAHRRGERVLLIDADESVGSLHMMLGILDPGPGLGALRGGQIAPEQLLAAVAPGFMLLSGGGGGVDMTLSSAAAERRALMRRISGLYEQFTTIIVDGGSRLDSVMASCGAGAERLVCVTAQDRISLAASYALFKVARARFEPLPVELIVNGVDEAPGRSLHAIVRAATQAFLGTDVSFGGAIPFDPYVDDALTTGGSLAHVHPLSPAAAAAAGVMHRLLHERMLASGEATPVIPLYERV